MSALASLVRAYDRMAARGEVPAYGYSPEKIGFVISLNLDGSVVGIPTDLRRGEGRKRIARALAVPQPPKRASGIAPCFLWDKTAYVLGVTAGEGKRTVLEHSAFVAYHREWLAGSDDEGLRALLCFLEAWSPERFAELGWPEEMKDQNVVFALESQRLDGVYIHSRPAARDLWTRIAAAGEKNQAVCLVTGERGPVARLHPAIKGVWGAQSAGASIVSFNLDAFSSYGHKQGDNAPLSEAAAFAYTSALNRFLLRDSGHRIQIGDASTVFWAEAAETAAAEAEALFGFFTGDEKGTERIGEKRIEALLAKLRAGRPVEDFRPDLPENVRFFVLGLAPNAARLSVRFYLEDEFGVIAERYLRHMERMRIEPPPKDETPSMWRMLIETAPQHKSDNIQPNLAGEWMRAILTGTPYPLTLLSTLLMRLRADHDVNALRVAILKSILIRNKKMEVPVALDLANTQPGYLLGRLFALYEHIQAAALGTGVNATIKDKFYGAASAQPRRVFHLLDSGSANHLSKIGKQNKGRQVNFEKQLGALMDLMTPGSDPFPAHLPDEQQGLFALGYYHQRNDFFRKAEKSEEPQA
ncbi:type I-C CRISPR-associated protein Cas8c/Csd1 [Labrys monachus]|uniref:CRISPR-associated protein Csd1 n=1 Tax=Labrys monachus TaxID=217067 RepID=A0ABU0FMN3_9HYPH|nr:type I-C CRISPR-associated protein Cas8c/Csd1 [Labrys monachus]MDQ0395874.1 CRISPR-associated protein Csd1 [Labrys monachus]